MSTKNEHSEAERGPQHQLSDERLRAFTALFTFATHDRIEETKRRSAVMDAVTALCRFQEPPVRRAYPGKQTILELAIESTRKGAKTVKPAKPIPIECLPTQCIFCLGKVDLAYEHRTKSFHSRGDLKKHFDRKHLRHIPDGQAINCAHPACNERLSNKKHLQNHVATVHITFT